MKHKYAMIKTVVTLKYITLIIKIHKLVMVAELKNIHNQ